jgi:hypothetical protein
MLPLSVLFAGIYREVGFSLATVLKRGYRQLRGELAEKWDEPVS